MFNKKIERQQVEDANAYLQNISQDPHNGCYIDNKIEGP